NGYRGMRTVQLRVVDTRPALTRVQREKALYDKLCAGEELTAKEARALLPCREEFINLWRYLQVHAAKQPLEGTCCHLTKCVARECDQRPVLMRTLVCLDVFHECGLIRLEETADHLRVTLTGENRQVDLEASTLMRQLRGVLRHAERSMAEA
ncbi:MAG: single-stranded-DNA-specific exonuclease RecJ, partial [Clostridiales bacterium]|nr:single-stranded-DNA-specific exonuclease RecJ [Clostridiales bacterium]